MNRLFLSLGGNEGNVLDNIRLAHQYLTETVGKIRQSSHVYQTHAWGNEDQPDFLNECIEVQSSHTAEEILQHCLDIEKKIGRKRQEKWGARPIDIDILFFNAEVINRENLIVPHPYLHKRNFVLIPLLEIAPDFVHPIFKKSIGVLAQECADPLEVKKTSLIL